MSGRWNTNVDGVALDGYDPVAYHAMHDAVRGMADLAVEHDGVRFLFASDEHRDAFREEPERYAPAFGGWCAFAVAAKKEMVKADPRTFKLYNGKLLLFFNDYYEGKPFNTVVPWNQDEPNMLRQAAANWRGMA